MPKWQNLAGRRFGRLTAVEYIETGAREPNGRRVRKWRCLCECGKEAQVNAKNLCGGISSSCGCLRKEVTSAQRRKHGMSAGGPTPRPEYVLWKGMLQRCSNPKHRSFHVYGGRGIKVCAEWACSFDAFYASVGPRPSPELTLERKDNERGYEPGNVCWATRKEQRANQRRPNAIPA